LKLGDGPGPTLSEAEVKIAVEGVQL